MNCQACQNMMLDFLAVDPQNIENKEFVDHIKACPTCQAEFHSQRQCWNMLGDVETIEPDPNFISRFWTTLSGQETWVDRLVQNVLSLLQPKVLVPVLSLLVLAVLVNGWLFIYSPHNALDDPLAYSLNGFEIEMAESMELVEYFDIIEDVDILLDFEIIEELDSLEA